MIDDALRYLWGADYSGNCIEIFTDPVRALVYIACNLIVTVCYVVISFEIIVWIRALNVRMSRWLGGLLAMLFLLCGVTHMSMLVKMPTTTWFFIGAAWIPLTVVSGLLAFSIRYNRHRLVATLTAARQLLDAVRAKVAAHDSHP